MRCGRAGVAVIFLTLMLLVEARVRVRAGMLTAEEAVDLYVDAWNASTREQRRRLIRRAFTEDGIMVGGHDTLRGPDTIAEFISQGQAEEPIKARRTSVVDTHGVWLRYEWEASTADGVKVADGLDVAELAEDGRLRCLVVFHPLHLPPQRE